MGLLHFLIRSPPVPRPSGPAEAGGGTIRPPAAVRGAAAAVGAAVRPAGQAAAIGTAPAAAGVPLPGRNRGC